MTGRRRASIIDVAQRAGVSVATVSRAMRDLPNVSSLTRERVMRAASELDYAASPLAAGLVTGRTRSVALLLPRAGGWYVAEAVRGVEGALREHRYDLVVHVLASHERRAEFFGDPPVGRRVDAVVMAGLGLDSAELAAIRRLALPLACVGDPASGVHAERVDHAAGARLAVEHLLGLGHRRIAMIGDARGGRGVAGLRRRGCRDALAEAGLSPVAEADGGLSVRGGEAAMARLLARRPGPPSAVFCGSDEMAFGALHALRRAGRRCPDDVSVVGFDDHELAEAFDLTTVAQPVAGQAAAAAHWLVSALAADEAGDERPLDTDARLHPLRLVRRGSSGPP